MEEGTLCHLPAQSRRREGKGEEEEDQDDDDNFLGLIAKTH